LFPHLLLAHHSVFSEANIVHPPPCCTPQHRSLVLTRMSPCTDYPAVIILSRPRLGTVATCHWLHSFNIGTFRYCSRQRRSVNSFGSLRLITKIFISSAAVVILVESTFLRIHAESWWLKKQRWVCRSVVVVTSNFKTLE
jgi:hypothetical protein